MSREEPVLVLLPRELDAAPLVLARLHSADLESSLVSDEVLSYADERSDAWLRAVALLMRRRPSEAVDAFAAPRMPRSCPEPKSSQRSAPEKPPTSSSPSPIA